MSNSTVNSEFLDQVEDYKISDVVIRNSVGKTLAIPIGVISELNIFEDIENNAVTGSMYILDHYNIVTEAGLQGNERLSFYLSTPGRQTAGCLLYTSPSPRDFEASRMPSSA